LIDVAVLVKRLAIGGMPERRYAAPAKQRNGHALKNKRVCLAGPAMKTAARGGRHLSRGATYLPL
jgi:hypothetical protein